MTNRARPLQTRFLLCSLVALQTMPAFAQPDSDTSRTPLQQRDGQHDFDFEFGTWNTRLSRLQDPLSGSTTWVEYEGISTVRPVWNGKANLGEIELTDPDGNRLQGLSLRLYNPESRQWSVHWSNSSSGTLGEAMVGGFQDGRGEFYNQETYRGQEIFVRFIFSDVTPTSFRLEQAFSADGGQTWEANWIAQFTRVSDATDQTR